MFHKIKMQINITIVFVMILIMLERRFFCLLTYFTTYYNQKVTIRIYVYFVYHVGKCFTGAVYDIPQHGTVSEKKSTRITSQIGAIFHKTLRPIIFFSLDKGSAEGILIGSKSQTVKSFCRLAVTASPLVFAYKAVCQREVYIFGQERRARGGSE